MKKALVAVSMGDKYNKQTERMIDNFISHNPDWDACWYYDDGLMNILPDVCRDWSPFNKCEIGRWFAMKHALVKYDSIVYSDGDMAWYAPYETSDYAMTLFPHYVTDLAKRISRHWLAKDGVYNIGIMEMRKCNESNEIIDFITEEVIANPAKHKHGEQLWLQNIVSVLPDCGYGVGCNNNAGYNVARWNIKHDRSVIKRDGKYIVRTCEGTECPLVSFHFSEKSIHTLDRYGEAVKELRNDYLRS